MIVESVYTGPIKVVVERIENLPRGYELLHVYPPIGVPHELDFADRNSEGVLILRQVAPSRGGPPVKVWYRVVDPPDLPVHTERCMEFELAGALLGEDTTGESAKERPSYQPRRSPDA